MNLKDMIENLIKEYGKDKVMQAVNDFSLTNADTHRCNKLGVDLSKWNPDFKGADAANVGIEFAIIRAGYGISNWDNCAKRHYKECVNNGIKTGFYWFSYAYLPSQAKEEAKCLLSFIKDKKVTYPLVFDFERESIDTPLNKDAINSIAEAFLSTIESAGYYAMFYTNRDFYLNIWDDAIKKKYDCWYARYQDNGYKDLKRCNLWQYTNEFKINSRNYDGDMSFIDYPRLIKDRGLNHL